MERDEWDKNTKNLKRAFSLVKYNTEFGKKKNNESCNLEYFILMDGMRPENYSKSGKDKSVTGWGISNILEELDKSDKRIKAISILLDNDAPLEEEAKLMAKYINNLKKSQKCSRIHVLGISKCGCVSVALLKYLEDLNLSKLNIMTYSAPYLGTIMASPVDLYKKIDEVVSKIDPEMANKILLKLGKTNPNNKYEQEKTIADIIKNKHWSLFSKSHMDYDISTIGGSGVPSKHKTRYDSEFLKNMFNEKVLNMLGKVKFTNITTCCSKKTLIYALKTHNVNAGILYLASKFAFDKPSDGLVALESATYIENICRKNGINISTLRIPDGHHDITSDSSIIGEIVKRRILDQDKSTER